jgi:hypothetical protein
MAQGHTVLRPINVSIGARIWSCWENKYLRMCLDNGLPPRAMRFFSISPKEIFLAVLPLSLGGSDC